MSDPGGGVAHVPLFELDTIDTSLLSRGSQWECEPCATRFVSVERSPECPYCALPLAARGESKPTFLPESVLPFKIPFDEASAAFQAWVKEQPGLMTPSDFVEQATADRMVGVYLPFFQFRCTASADYEVVSVHSTETSDGTRYTRTGPHTGTIEHEFVDLLVCSNTALPVDLIQKLEPWGLDDLQPYEADLLGEYTIESRGDPAELLEQGKEVMTRPLQESVRMKVGGSYLEILGFDVECKETRVRAFLFPLWIVSYRYGETVFQVLINARTGEVCGKPPQTLRKLALLLFGSIFGVMALVALALYLAGAFG